MLSYSAKQVAFYEGDYLEHDLRRGTLFSRTGTKMCYMPTELIEAMQRVLEDETGPAWRSILKTVGRIWGTRVARRFEKDVSEYYGRPLYELPMKELVSLLEGYFGYNGWGSLKLDFAQADSGVILARLENSAFAEIIGASETPIDSIVSGLLAEFVSQVSERDDIECYETECTAMGAPACRFIVGIRGRLKKVGEWIEDGMTHDEVVKRLTHAPGKGVRTSGQLDTQKVSSD